MNGSAAPMAEEVLPSSAGSRPVVASNRARSLDSGGVLVTSTRGSSTRPVTLTLMS